jgi:uncharacterized protein YecT (DUF1311 family)
MKPGSIILSLILRFGLLGANTSAQDIDCGKAASTADQYQCANRELAASEADLKDAYAAALRQYSHSSAEEGTAWPKGDAHDQSQYEGRMRRALIGSQRAWLQYRVTACNSVREMYDGGTITGPAVALCQAELTKQRTKFLRDYFGEK